MRFKYVIVDWVDIVHANRWHSLAEAAMVRPAMCRSMGVVVRHDKNELVLASTVGIADVADDTRLGVISIPVGCVRRIRKLKRSDISG